MAKQKPDYAAMTKRLEIKFDLKLEFEVIGLCGVYFLVAGTAVDANPKLTIFWDIETHGYGVYTASMNYRGDYYPTIEAAVDDIIATGVL